MKENEITNSLFIYINKIIIKNNKKNKTSTILLGYDTLD